MTKEIVKHYTEAFDEARRLDDRIGPFEYERTTEIISRYLDRKQLRVIDVGGGTGTYALWLTEQGHLVHIVDLVPRHISIVMAKAKDQSLNLGSAILADARSLPFGNHVADCVLLMGPLYHLNDRNDRLQALRESGRVVRKGGRVLCTAISRFASMLAGFRFSRFNDPDFEAIVDKDLCDGQHRNADQASRHLGNAFLHKADELRQEIESSGLVCEKIVGIEGPFGLLSRLEDWIQERGRMYQLALKYARRIEEEEGLLGASFHLMGVARLP